jgi:hypothetical protein
VHQHRKTAVNQADREDKGFALHLRCLRATLLRFPLDYNCWVRSTHPAIPLYLQNVINSVEPIEVLLWRVSCQVLEMGGSRAGRTCGALYQTGSQQESALRKDGLHWGLDGGAGRWSVTGGGAGRWLATPQAISRSALSA